MDSAEFIRLLLRSLAGPRRASRRQILRIACDADYRALLRTVRDAKKTFRRLSSVEPLPIIRAFVFRGELDRHALRKLIGRCAVEEDAPVTVHALPVPASPPEWISKPFIPAGIRAVRVPAVWKKSLGERVRIGVIDTGVDFSHPELQTCLARGINLVHPRMPPLDDNGHGTHIAGIIAAAGRYGMRGIAPHAVLVPVKAFDHQGSAYVSDIIKGIDWCVHQGVHIINMSFGMKQRSESMLEAVKNARRAGVVIVASAGNDGKRGFVDYPARFKYTISVGAIDARGGIAPFSNRSRRIDVFAPGEKVLSTWPRGRYREMTGTSMATPHVTGVLALAMAARPGLTPDQARKLILAARIPLKVKVKGRTVRFAGRLDAVRVFRRLKL